MSSAALATGALALHRAQPSSRRPITGVPHAQQDSGHEFGQADQGIAMQNPGSDLSVKAIITLLQAKQFDLIRKRLDAASPEEAEKLILRALEIDPGSLETYPRLGQMLLAVGNGAHGARSYAPSWRCAGHTMLGGVVSMT